MKYMFLALVPFFGCMYNNLPPQGPLEGRWVETVNRKDTIFFDQRLNGNDKAYFIFKSDKEISGYNDLHVAIYEYKVRGGKISIYNTLSSCYCFSEYSFTRFGDKLRIGNFYDTYSTGDVEEFENLD